MAAGLVPWHVPSQARFPILVLQGGLFTTVSHQRSPQVLFLSSKLLQNLATESYFLCSWVLKARNLEWHADCFFCSDLGLTWEDFEARTWVTRRLDHSQVSRCLGGKHLGLEGCMHAYSWLPHNMAASWFNPWWLRTRM